jgi:hypothetical protein
MLSSEDLASNRFKLTGKRREGVVHPKGRFNFDFTGFGFGERKVRDSFFSCVVGA